MWAWVAGQSGLRNAFMTGEDFIGGGWMQQVFNCKSPGLR